MSARIRLSLSVLLAFLLAAAVDQAPLASASTGPVPSHTRGALAAAHGSDPFSMVRRDSAAAPGDSTPAASSGRGSFGSALVGSAPVQPGPSAVAVNQATDTIYVANGFNPNGPTNAGGDTVSVINGRHCNARDVSRCQGPWPTIKVGNLPSNIAVDQATDTVFVTVPGDNTVAVFDGAICNSRVTWGCHRTPVHVPVGLGPFGIVADDANHTVYISNSDGANGSGSTTVSMLNSATCTAAHLGSCPTTPPPTVDVGSNPIDVDVNQATHTVYVTTFSTAHRALTGRAVFNATTCNATVQSGCTTIGRLIGDPVGPEAGVVDPANDTLYSANFDNTLSAFDLRHCDASDLAGCAAQKPGTVTVAPPADPGIAFWLVVDAPLHTVYVVNQKDDTLSAVNTDVCNGSHLRACASLRPPTIHTGEDPESVDLNPDTQTLYTANQVSNDVSVIDAARCNATITSGCRQPPPAITLTEPGASAADPAAGTVYIATGTNTMAMINTRTCNAARHDGCAAAPPTVTVGAGPSGIAVNPRTHTVYVANFGSANTGSVTVLDDRTCNATTTSGCTNARTLHVPGGNAQDIAVNPATGTLYVATAPPGGPNGPTARSTVSVFNGATCNATTSTGCGQAPHSVTVGFDALALAVNARTDTIYVANFAQKNNLFAGNTVSVINGIACNATATTGCGNPPQTITLGPAFTSPVGIAIDQATDTIYVANLENGEGSGTVSVINGAICNATTSTGCRRTPPTPTAGFGPSSIAFDPANRTVVVTNIEDTSISVINANSCNATTTTGCHHPQPKFPAGRAPRAVSIDPAVGTIYVSNGDNTVSIIPTT
jgi:YVTN family beta-propeller protein